MNNFHEKTICNTENICGDEVGEVTTLASKRNSGKAKTERWGQKNDSLGFSFHLSVPIFLSHKNGHGLGKTLNGSPASAVPLPSESGDSADSVDLEKSKLTLGPLLRLDSDKEKFLDNPRADAFLTREYRKPFVVPTEKEV